MSSMFSILTLGLVSLTLVNALGGPSCITFTPSSSSFTLATKSGSYAVPILTDSTDDSSVHIAANTFAEDIYRVSSSRPQVFNDSLPGWATNAIIVGTASSGLLKGLSMNMTGDLEGMWEAYDSRVVQSPMEGVEQALVITGSDKRGTIFGMYDLSEQMGVSPWYFWADVPIVQHETIAFTTSAVCSHGEPTVKYRGIFINDEQPVLTSWVQAYYDLGPDTPPFGTWIYEPMFELILRLKANYFWPAEWSAQFDVDGLNITSGLPTTPTPGPNQDLANSMGIVMGTSHQEPMARNTPEWNTYGKGDWNFTTNSVNLTEFWRYGAERAKGKDTLFTVGMRGNGDIPLAGANIPIIENITASQQEILKEVFNTSDVSMIPQMWCMYKEVMGYFANGLSVPDDGIYFVSLEQGPAADQGTVTILLADDNWGNLMAVLPWGDNHTAGGGVYYHVDYVGDPRDYKWINTVALEARSQAIYDGMDTYTQAAYFELVHAPIALNANLNRLYVSAGKSNLYATQFRSSANLHAQDAMYRLSQDHVISSRFESLYNDKWKYMLSQPHINYQYWQQPMRNTLPPVSFVQQTDYSHSTTFVSTRFTVENSAGAWPGDNKNNCAQGYSCPDPTMLVMDPFGASSRWVEVSSGGPMDTTFEVESNVSWLIVDPASGKICADGSTDTKVYISVDWSQVPAPSSDASFSAVGKVNFTSSDGAMMIATVPINNTIPPPETFHGFVEGDGYVVMEAAHFTSNTSKEGYAFQEIEWYGRTLSGVEMFPVTNQNFTLGSGPYLGYDFWAVDSINGTSDMVQVTVQIGPSLNYFLGEFLSFGLQMDQQDPITINPVPNAPLGSLPADWNAVTAAEVRSVSVIMKMGGVGEHTLKVWGMTTGVVVERIWVDMGGIVKRGNSYFGPPESRRV